MSYEIAPRVVRNLRCRIGHEDEPFTGSGAKTEDQQGPTGKLSFLTSHGPLHEKELRFVCVT